MIIYHRSWVEIKATSKTKEHFLLSTLVPPDHENEMKAKEVGFSAGITVRVLFYILTFKGILEYPLYNPRRKVSHLSGSILLKGTIIEFRNIHIKLMHYLFIRKKAIVMPPILKLVDSS